MKETCIIVGAGHAAAQLAPSLRREGWQGRILVVGEEPYIPYHRPPLSKELLAGGKELDEINIRPEAIYQKDGIEFMLNTRVDGIDRKNRTLILQDNNRLPYDRLVLATGSRVRRLDIPGCEFDGICYLRSYQDAVRIRSFVEAGGKAVIVGAGYIGLEAAAVLRKLDMEVTVIEVMDRVLQRVTAPEISEFFTRIHTEEGVKILCNTGVVSFAGDTAVERVLCDDGSQYEADLVIVGVGILPDTKLAEDAGLEVDNGIVVDELCRTSDPGIMAAGDCTNFYSKLYNRRIRLESVQNATDQARTAAATVCDNEKPYDALPWFWSDQFDLKLQIAGLSQGYEEVVTRGRYELGRSFAAFYLKKGHVIAVDAVNRPAEFMVGRKLITEMLLIDKDKLADDSISMKELLT